ncbi:MAG: hypothetical protein Q7T25_07095, partial [Sideroxyarcus sp.]|nr:hypothetical protein [Sideroxyarcus sp.]
GPLSVNNEGQITIKDQFKNAGSSMVETLQLFNSDGVQFGSYSLASLVASGFNSTEFVRRGAGATSDSYGARLIAG